MVVKKVPQRIVENLILMGAWLKAFILLIGFAHAVSIDRYMTKAFAALSMPDIPKAVFELIFF